MGKYLKVLQKFMDKHMETAHETSLRMANDLARTPGDRSKCQMYIKELESLSPTKTKYYASILDFEKDDLGYLEMLREKATEHMTKVHGYDGGERDRLELYFHFPYTETTATVHLHVRLNQGRPAMEAHKSFYLQDIIHHLTTHENLYELVGDRFICDSEENSLKKLQAYDVFAGGVIEGSNL